MAAGSKAREILNYSFLVALANDGVIDDGELSYIKSLAMADGVLDERERDALRRVFARVDESKLSALTVSEYRKFRERYDLW